MIFKKVLLPLIGTMSLGLVVGLSAVSCSSPDANSDMNKKHLNVNISQLKTELSNYLNEENLVHSSSSNDLKDAIVNWNVGINNPKQISKINFENAPSINNKYVFNVSIVLNDGYQFNGNNVIYLDNVTSNILVNKQTLNWDNTSNSIYIDLANNDNDYTFKLNENNFSSTPVINYFATSNVLNLNNLPLLGSSDTITLPSSLLTSLKQQSSSYIPITIIAKTHLNNGTLIQSNDLNLVFYNSQNIKTNNDKVKKLFWLPEEYNSKYQYVGKLTDFTLVTPYNLENGERFVLYKTIQSNINNQGVVTQDLTLNNEQFSFELSNGFQNLQLCVLNKNNQIVAQSNILSINAIKEYSISLKSDQMTNGLIKITNPNVNLSVETNIPNFKLSLENIYYQNQNTNNKWMTISALLPKYFKLKVVNNQLFISDFYTNFATNFRIYFPEFNTYSNIVTVSSLINNGSYYPNVYVNGKMIEGDSFTTSDQSIVLSFKNNLNAKLFMNKVWMYKNKNWQEVSLNNDDYKFTPDKKGTYVFKVESWWKNNSISPSVTKFISINFKPDLSQDNLNSYSKQLQEWISHPNNVLNIYKEMLKNNPDWLLSYLTSWGYGYRLSLSKQDIDNIFDNWSILLKNNQVF